MQAVLKLYLWALCKAYTSVILRQLHKKLFSFIYMYAFLETWMFYVVWPYMMEETEELLESYQHCLVAHCPFTCLDQNKYPERGGEKCF